MPPFLHAAGLRLGHMSSLQGQTTLPSAQLVWRLTLQGLAMAGLGPGDAPSMFPAPTELGQVLFPHTAGSGPGCPLPTSAR